MRSDEISVELVALASDADAWDCVAESHRRLRNAVEDLTLSVTDLHPRADSRWDAAHEYQVVMERLRSQLNNARRAAVGGAEALRDIRDEYRQTEEASDELASMLLRDVDQSERVQ